MKEKKKFEKPEFMKEKKKFEKPELQVEQLKMTGMICESTCSVDCGSCGMNN